MLFRNPFSNRNRKVRMHLSPGSEADGATVEGVLAGETRRHYILWAPRVIDAGPEGMKGVEVSGHVEIPRERVLFFQVLG